MPSNRFDASAVRPPSSPEPARALTDLATVIRSKNAGPTRLTLDLFFRDDEAFACAAASAALQPKAIAVCYGLADLDAVERHEMPSIRALKFTLPRSVCAGSPGDGDVYGAQQHGPLLDLQV